MKLIAKMKFGSHLYGTETENSDLDFKGVYLPSSSDILLQRVKAVHNTTTKLNNHEKNTSTDVDLEYYSLQKFLGLLVEGQTVAMDMLFCPKHMLLESTYIWDEIIKAKHNILTKSCNSMIGYCYQQASKYGIRGSRVAAARAARDLFESAVSHYGTQGKVSLVAGALADLCKSNEHCKILEIENRNATGTDTLTHFECCDKKVPYTITLKAAYDLYKGLFDRYGERAKLAETNSGVDWKALSHAVRIGRQGVELLSSGNMTFPRPEAKHLLDIKLGKLPYNEVSAEIESLLEQVKAASEASNLPEKPDYAWLDMFILNCHANVVLDNYR